MPFASLQPNAPYANGHCSTVRADSINYLCDGLRRRRGLLYSNQTFICLEFVIFAKMTMTTKTSVNYIFD